MKLDKTLFNTVNKWKLATCLLAILTVLGSSLYISAGAVFFGDRNIQ